MIKNDEAHLNIAAISHPGAAGKKNEDRHKVTAFHAGEEERTPAVLAVLCDGVGGHRAGEIAAEMGVSIITEVIIAGDSSQPLKTMQKAIVQASNAIYGASKSDQGRKGMGATCACAWVIGHRLYTANLGDSRIYLLRKGHIVQLTTDHTWMQEALDAGVIHSLQPDNHPNAHVIRRYLGSKKPPKPDFRLWYFEGEHDEDALNNQGLPLEPGDRLLLCSDGLTDLVSDEEIRSIVQEGTFDLVPETLLSLANDRGGHDNTTIVLLEVPGKRVQQVPKPRKRRWFAGCLIAGIFLLLLVLAVYFGIQRWSSDINQPTDIPTVVTEPPLIELFLTEDVPITPTMTQTATLEMLAPRPTRTPWPTHTSAP